MNSSAHATSDGDHRRAHERPRLDATSRPRPRPVADPPEVASGSAAAPASVFTPDSIVYTPCRPTEITRRRLSTSNAITASTNGVMSR